VPNADLDLLIKTVFHDGRTRVSYTLQSPSGKARFSYREIAGPEISGRPEDYQAYLISKIEKLGEGRDVDDSPLLSKEIEGKLTKIGRELHLELFTPEMRQAYREIRSQGVQSIRIVSDEPWIPWELIKPYDDSIPGEVIDDEFLCLQFELTRWLAGDRVLAPLSELRVRRLACILTATGLPKTGEEKAFLAVLAQTQPGVQDASRVLSSSSAAEAFLEAGGVDLLHFAGHGTFDAARPNESAIPFPDGSLLRPTDFQGSLATRIAQDRPFVFLNACSVGQQGWSLARLGGWADRWVRICGCGAFVAPLWLVRDSLALEFAKAFYTALTSGETFGQAGRSARMHVRKLAPGDPSWLAYSIYADVQGRLALGDSELPELPMARNAAPEILRPPDGRVFETEGQSVAEEGLPRAGRKLPPKRESSIGKAKDHLPVWAQKWLGWRPASLPVGEVVFKLLGGCGALYVGAFAALLGRVFFGWSRADPLVLFVLCAGLSVLLSAIAWSSARRFPSLRIPWIVLAVVGAIYVASRSAPSM